MTEAAIEVRGLAKSFGELAAVRGVNFEVAPGEVFGFLGPNGAGKTPTINMLCTLMKPSAGSARVAGYDVVTARDDVRRHIGLVFQDPTLDNYLTAEQNMRLHAELYGVPRELVEPRMQQVLEMVGLWERRRSAVATFSGGMKRRLEIARVFLHTPKILFLDEPTLGLDPQSRNQLWTHVKNLNQSEGVTVFLTTHYMDEADRVAQRIAVIDHGKIVAQGTPAELKQQTNSETLEQAFLALTGSAVREESANSADQLRQFAKAWRR